MNTRILLPLLCVVVLLSGCGMTASSRNDGYADLEAISGQDVDARMSLSLGPAVLGFAAAMSRDDPKAGLLLKELQGVRVKVYDVEGDAERVAASLDRMRDALVARGWEQAVRVREAGETTYVLMKTNDEVIAGLTVLSSDSLEVVIVNVMGNLHPESFSQAMAALEVSGAANGSDTVEGTES